MGGIDHAVIVGAGFSGTLQAINLLRAGVPHVTLVERRANFARGVAYSTANPAHLLNVRVGNMSAFEHEPDHFRRWLARRSTVGAEAFVSRQMYGDYLMELLHDTLAEQRGRLDLRHDGAIEIAADEHGETVVLAGGECIRADAAIIAPGNLPPHDPSDLSCDTLGSDLYVGDPWAVGLSSGLTDYDTVMLVGTGLTMVDVALTLESEGFRGRIVALSRHGLLPRAHDTTPSPADWQDAPRSLGSSLVRQTRREADRLGWRTAMDAVRPHVQGIWRGASKAEQARFLRHLRPWWDVHRHRLAPPVAASVEQWRESGWLDVLAGRLIRAAADSNGVEVRWRPRGAAEERQLHVRRIINCTGPQGNLLRTREPLLQLLLSSGRIRPDPHRLGLDVTSHNETVDADGVISRTLLAIGPMTRGTFWEIVAVPDIRNQTTALAHRLAAA